MRALAATGLLVAVVAACAGGPAEPAPSPASAADGCPGPWTACADGAALRAAAEEAGLGVVGETGSAWIVATERARFFLWSTDARDGSARAIARGSGARPLVRAGGRQVWDDGIRRFWGASGRVVWTEAGPAEADEPPGPAELEPLVAATLRLTPP